MIKRLPLALSMAAVVVVRILELVLSLAAEEGARESSDDAVATKFVASCVTRYSVVSRWIA